MIQFSGGGGGGGVYCIDISFTRCWRCANLTLSAFNFTHHLLKLPPFQDMKKNVQLGEMQHPNTHLYTLLVDHGTFYL